MKQRQLQIQFINGGGGGFGSVMLIVNWLNICCCCLLRHTKKYINLKMKAKITSNGIHSCSEQNST